MADTDAIQLLFPTVVASSDLETAPELNNGIVEAVQKIRSIEPNSKPPSWACQLYTTIGNPRLLLEHQAFIRLREIITEKLAAFAQAHAYPMEAPPRITECWLNVYQPGQAQEIHLHRNSLISGIYYVKAPPGAGATCFYSPLADVMLAPNPIEGNKLNARVTAFEPVEGRMLLFRSSLRHSVLPGEFEGERMTIAFNAML